MSDDIAPADAEGPRVPDASGLRGEAWIDALGPLAWRDWVEHSKFADDLAGHPRGTLARAWLHDHGIPDRVVDERLAEAEALRAIEEAHDRAVLDEVQRRQRERPARELVRSQDDA